MSGLKRSLILLAIALPLGFVVKRLFEIFPNPIHTSRKATIASRVKEYGDVVKKRWEPDFRRAGVSYPPARVVLVGLKDERKLEVYAAGFSGPLRFIREYPIKRASGKLGPKLREGDYQVPEGLYGIECLNPNSRFHLALKVDYPNAFDRKRAVQDGRKNLGGDIMIHGKEVSSGCVAMGDEASEDLFVLADLTGIKNVSVILSPLDFRTREMPPLPTNATPLPAWTELLYPKIKEELKKLSRS